MVMILVCDKIRDNIYCPTHSCWPILGSDCCIRWVHNEFAKMFELDTNERFCHVVCNHILSWTVFDLDFVPINQVSNIEELDMEMTCMLSGACFTILLQSHRAGIVSIDNVGFNFKTLGFNEKF
jgi:hypothetical protein